MQFIVVIVKIYEEQGRIVAMDVCGRASASRAGAAVESAVAAISHTLLIGLQSLRRIALEWTEEQDCLHINIRRGRSRNDVQLLMSAAKLGLQQQARRYPCQVRVVERILYPGGVVL